MKLNTYCKKVCAVMTILYFIGSIPLVLVHAADPSVAPEGEAHITTWPNPYGPWPAEGEADTPAVAEHPIFGSWTFTGAACGTQMIFRTTDDFQSSEQSNGDLVFTPDFVQANLTVKELNNCTMSLRMDYEVKDSEIVFYVIEDSFDINIGNYCMDAIIDMQLSAMGKDTSLFTPEEREAFKTIMNMSQLKSMMFGMIKNTPGLEEAFGAGSQRQAFFVKDDKLYINESISRFQRNLGGVSDIGCWNEDETLYTVYSKNPYVLYPPSVVHIDGENGVSQ